MKHAQLFILSSLLIIALVPQSQQKSLEEIQQEEQEKIRQLQEEYLQKELEIQEIYNNYEKSISDAYQKIEREEARRVQEMEQKILAQWNDKKISTKKEYVDYDKNLKTRGRINFEKGEVLVEVIQEEEKEAPGTAKEQINQKLKDIIKEKDDSDTPVLADQLKEKVTPKNAGKLVDKYDKDGKIKREKIKGGDGKTRYKYSLKLSMVPNHLRVRLNRYKNEILKQSKRFDIDPALVCAIIHTESYFNPKAKSHVPAYGLMQLVPRSGARDAYLHVYKKDRLLRAGYLYNPSNNIELGCGYIALLKYGYLKKIKNNTKNDLCTICAYNTGAGNVAYAINGTKSINKAAAIINSRDTNWLKDKLLSDLPYGETKNYLKKVSERRGIYKRALDS